MHDIHCGPKLFNMVLGPCLVEDQFCVHVLGPKLFPFRVHLSNFVGPHVCLKI